MSRSVAYIPMEGRGQVNLGVEGLKKKKEFNTHIVRVYKMNCLPRNASCRVR